jgi:hypothetical protein
MGVAQKNLLDMAEKSKIRPNLLYFTFFFFFFLTYNFVFPYFWGGPWPTPVPEKLCEGIFKVDKLQVH